MPLPIAEGTEKVAPAIDSPRESAVETPASAYVSSQHRRRIRLGMALAALAIVIVLAAIAIVSKRTKASGFQPDTAPIYADTSATVRLNGKTAAVRARSVQAPLLAGEKVGTLTITTLVPSGSVVKQGDLLVEFDRQAQLRDFIDKQAESSAQDEKVIEEQATESAARAKDETAILQAQSDLSKAKLEMQKTELLSAIDVEKAQEELDQAQATLAQLKDTFDLKRKAAQASLRILEIQRDRTRESMAHAQANAALMQIRSPIDGIVVFNTIWKEGNMGEVKDGDQVRPGVPFLQVVDPSLMEVQVPINQEDLLGLKVGQIAQVHLDAYPDLTFQGRLESIDPMSKNGDFSSKVRSFAATFSIEGSDPRLMPDLSAAVDVRSDNAQTRVGRAK